MKRISAVLICLMMIIGGCKSGGSSGGSSGGAGGGADLSIPAAGPEDYTHEDYEAIFKMWEEFNIAYTDADGGSTAPVAAGTLNIGTLEINDGAGADHASSGALILTGLTVDVDSVNGVEIGLPAITGRISIGSIDMGTGTSIGSVTLTNLNMAGTSVNIRGH